MILVLINIQLRIYFNVGIAKYYEVKTYIVFLTLVLVNKQVNFKLKTRNTFFCYYFCKKKKNKYVSYTKSVFNSKNQQIKYIMKLLGKQILEGPTNKLKKFHNFFKNFLI